jgi:hypothetical protein
MLALDQSDLVTALCNTNEHSEHDFRIKDCTLHKNLGLVLAILARDSESAILCALRSSTFLPRFTGSTSIYLPDGTIRTVYSLTMEKPASQHR